MSLPMRHDINVYDSLDERVACEHFFGRSLDEAEQLFRENSLLYQEDLMWMGPAAFRYYVQAAGQYIQSEAAVGDSAIVACLLSILNFRLEREPHELRPIAGQLESLCAYVVEHYSVFEVSVEIYGDLRPRFTQLRARLRNLPLPFSSSSSG